MSRELVYNILKFVLSSDKSDYDVFTGVDAEHGIGRSACTS